ncbi:hypothetical protein [Amycolatopsis plumensis]|uniref:Uncharacterized protein n=1 Tax=Amycolatopsis plumensis TaxID=236508 RepID=A0ABV5UB13_9PSEU
MIPEIREWKRLDLRQLAGRLRGLDPARLSPPPHEGYWLLLEQRFRTEFLTRWRTLDSAGWRECAEVADELSALVVSHGGLSPWHARSRRFHLFTELLLEAGPRIEVPLTDPARLLRAFLDGFPYSPAEAEPRLGTGLPELHLPMLLMPQLRRVEHLFPPGPDLDTYRAWQDVLSRSSGVPESERTPWPRGDEHHGTGQSPAEEQETP